MSDFPERFKASMTGYSQYLEYLEGNLVSQRASENGHSNLGSEFAAQPARRTPGVAPPIPA